MRHPAAHAARASWQAAAAGPGARLDRHPIHPRGFGSPVPAERARARAHERAPFAAAS